MKLAINGFGRIGRCVYRQSLLNDDVEVVAINARYDAKTLAHLVQFDSVHGPFSKEVKGKGDYLCVEGKKTLLTNERNPSLLPWEKLEVDVVVDATGAFKTEKECQAHLDAGAKKVVITAPAKDDTATFVMGVNEGEYKGEAIVSNASCTTNALTPILRTIHDAFGIENGMMTTIHSYTNDQNNLDNPHKDLRRARACGMSMIPTTTGAAKAVEKVFPALKGKIHGMAVRVPTPNVSMIDLVVDVEKYVSKEGVEEVLKWACEKYPNVLSYCSLPLVSQDFVTSSYSSIIDGMSTAVLANKKIKIISYYDNEWGYSSRVLDLSRHIHSHAPLPNESSPT
jgi:glyceraldehyde 3-phosphate dehydrogenase